MFRFTSKAKTDTEIKPPVTELPKPPAKPIVIFDFDGVIANSLEHLLEVSNKFAADHKLKIKVENYQQLIGIRANASASDLFKGMLVSRTEVIKAIADKLADKVRETTLYPGIKEVVTQLRELGAIVGIITTNRLSTVQEFLKFHQIEDLFHFAKSSEGDAKNKLLKATIKDHHKEHNKDQKNTKDNTLYITGRTDYVVESDVRSVTKTAGVLWGFDDKAAFTKAKPDHLVEKPEEIINLISVQPEPKPEEIKPTQPETRCAV